MPKTAAPSAQSLSQGVATEVHQVTTPNGTAWFSASHAAASLAIADVQAWQSEIQSGTTAMPRLGIAAPVVGAAAGIFGATGVWGNLGVSVANLVMGTLSAKGNNDTKAASLQIAIANQSSSTVALYKATPENADIANVVPPLASGDSGVFVIARSGGFSGGTKGASKLDLTFRIGGGTDQGGNPATNSVYAEFNFEYVKDGGTPKVSSPGRWILAAGIDNSDKHDYGIGNNTLQLYGGTFIGNPGSPNFAFYTSSIETGSGQIDIVFYDCAAGSTAAAPVCLITSPTGGKVSGTATIEAVVVTAPPVYQANLTATQVSNPANVHTIGGPNSSPMQFAWDTTSGCPDGVYRLSVTAQGYGGQNPSGTSDFVYVNVQN
jgi:hypothetical protein